MELKIQFIKYICFFLLLSSFTENSFGFTETFVGGNPLSIDITSDGKFAALALHSPPTEESPNLVIVNLDDKTIVKSYRIRLRMLQAVFIETSAEYASNPGSEFDNLAIAAIFGDQSSLTIINPETGEIIKDINTSPRPSSIKVHRSYAYITGSTTGDVSIIDLAFLKYKGSSPRIGIDPRNFEIVEHSSSIDYAYVALGGENALAVYQITKISLTPTYWKLLNKIPVGFNPSDIEVNSEGSNLVVANLSGKSVSVFDLSRRSNPTLIKDINGQSEWKVGNFPSSVSRSSDQNVFYVANAESPWITLVNVSNKTTHSIRYKEDENLSYSTVLEKKGLLYGVESGPNANLTIAETNQFDPFPLPELEELGEPSIFHNLSVNSDLACPGFYFSQVSQQQFANGGVWGKELLLKGNNRTFQGGLILKSNFKGDAGYPGYGGFNIANRNNEAQKIEINITQLTSYESRPAQVEVSLRDQNGNDILDSIQGSENLSLNGELLPGFYYFRVKSLEDSPSGEFLADISTSYIDRPGGGFQGGAIIGGYFSPDDFRADQKMFSAFCIADAKDIEINTFGKPSYGLSGAGNLVLSLLDRNRIPILTNFNTPLPSPPMMIPISPEITAEEFNASNIRIVYIDASSQYSGTGSTSRPYRSITNAITKTNRSNVIYYVRPGLYSPSTTDEKLPIGSKNPNVQPLRDNVWILGEDPENTIIDAEFSLRHDRSRVTALQISSVDNVRVSGLTIKNSLSAGIFINNSKNVRVDHNLLVGNARFGVGAQSVNRLIVDNNLVLANNESGIVASNSQPLSSNNIIKTPEGCPELFGVCIINNTANDQRADGILVSQGGDYFIKSNTANGNGISGIEINNRYTESGTRPVLSGKILDNELSQNGGDQLSHVGSGILVTEFAHASSISGNNVHHNLPGGIAVFEDSSTGQINQNKVYNNEGNGIIVQKRSDATEISSNDVSNNGLTGIFLASNVSVGEVTNNTSKFNGQCTECLDAKNGLAILGNSNVEIVENNNISNNNSGVQIANESFVLDFKNNQIHNNHNIGLFVRNASGISFVRNIEIGNNQGDHAFFISDSSADIGSLKLLDNKGEGLTITNSYARVSNTLIKNQEKEGIYLRSGSHLRLHGSLIEEGKGWGIIATSENTTVELTNTTIENNKSGIIAQNGAIIHCMGGNSISNNNNTQISGNTVNCE